MEADPVKSEAELAEDAELMSRIFTPRERKVYIGTAVPSERETATLNSELEQIRYAHAAGALAAQDMVVR